MFIVKSDLLRCYKHAYLMHTIPQAVCVIMCRLDIYRKALLAERGKFFQSIYALVQLHAANLSCLSNCLLAADGQFICL